MSSLLFSSALHRHAAPFSSAAGARSQRPRRAVGVAARAESKVQQLLQRDKKNVEVVDPSAFDDAPAASSSAAPAAAAAPRGKQAASGAKQGGGAPKQAAQAKGPQRSREAIDLGLERFQQGDYAGAIELFELALELPGSGVMRMAGSVREYSCPSPGEENAALYNMACAYARMGQRGPALTCIEALLENEFEDIDSIRKDPDLAPIRGAELDKLLAKQNDLLSKVLKKKESSSSKPWILW